MRYLQLYHDTSLSQIVSKDINNFTIRQQKGNGFLFIHGDQLHLRSQSTNEPYFVGTNNGTVQLYYDNSVKFNTAAIGIVVTGTTDTDGLVVSGVTTTTGDVTIGSAGENSALGVRFNSTYAQIKLPDGQTGSNRIGNLSFGDNDDFRIVHDGHHNYITAGTGDIFVSTSSANPVNIRNSRVDLNV